MPFTEEQMKQVFDTNIIDFVVRHGFEVEKGDRNTVHVKHSGGLYLFRHGQVQANQSAEAFAKAGYKIFIQTPQTKDFNEDLLTFREMSARSRDGPERTEADEEFRLADAAVISSILKEARKVDDVSPFVYPCGRRTDRMEQKKVDIL